MSRETYFADVVLPLPLPGTFTYRIPNNMNGLVKRGQRVIVQFGRRKIYTALVYKVHQRVPQKYEAKYISSLLDEEPILFDHQFQLWDWMAKYYLCTLGEVMNAALPSALKLASETKILLAPSFNEDYSNLNEKEFLIVEALESRKSLTLTEVSDIINQKKIFHIVKNLIEKNVVIVEEEVKQKYKPKKETYIGLVENYTEEKTLQSLFNDLENKAPKQLEILMTFISMQGVQDQYKEIKRPLLLERSGASASVINSLLRKKILYQVEREISRLKQYNKPEAAMPELSVAQSKAYEEINRGFQSINVILLHGVTASGKTEIYVKLMQEAIDQGKQVLYLLPEIALTTQIINRLSKFFGNKIAVYHSKFSQNERAEVWQKILQSHSKGKSQIHIALGARSALFLPFHNLGLIIVDEEHETTFKQFEPAPRYNARDAAIYLSTLNKAKVLLGSATPSVESYNNALKGKYQLVEIKKRYKNIQMPEILVVDVKEEMKRKKMKSHFSAYLIEQVNEALDNHEQIIFFQNRRGFSQRIVCDVCEWSPECKNCDVTLTYHKYYNQLKCHYCGYSIPVPSQCSACGAPKLLFRGFGTEKVEDEIPLFFPTAKTIRMDLDTTRSKNAYQRIINDFEDRKIDILVGTQMITKGLDFDNVSIVGILNADNMLNFPDFRAFERSYQLMSQVSGRAGRKNKRGKVIIQTFNPYHAIIRNVIDGDYIGMYKDQILDRRNFKYPPFYRLVRLTLKYKEAELLNRGADKLAKNLRKTFGNRVLGPEYPLVARVKNEYLKQLIIKLEKGNNLHNLKEKLREALQEFANVPEYKRIKLVIDVDPL